MKRIHILLGISLLFTGMFLTACGGEEGEEGEMVIKLEEKSGYVSSSSTHKSGETLKFSVLAEAENEKDPIIRFTVSDALNGGDKDQIHQEDLEVFDFETDYSYELTDSISGNTHELTFTVINRDGKTEGTSVVITVE